MKRLLSIALALTLMGSSVAMARGYQGGGYSDRHGYNGYSAPYRGGYGYRDRGNNAAAAVGVPDDLYGEDVAGFVVLKEGKAATEEEIVAFCRERLADYKCPKQIVFLDDIPKGPTGKLLKRELSRNWGKG